MEEEKCLSIYSHEDVVLKFCDKAALNKRFLTYHYITGKCYVILHNKNKCYKYYIDEQNNKQCFLMRKHDTLSSKFCKCFLQFCRTHNFKKFYNHDKCSVSSAYLDMFVHFSEFTDINSTGNVTT